MSTRNIRRQATVPGYASATNVPIYVDSDDNILKMIPAGSGTSEVQILDASSAQTLTTKTFTNPTINAATLTGALASTGTYTYTGAAAANGVIYANTTATAVGTGSVRAIVGQATTFTTITSGTLVGVRGAATMAGAASGATYMYGVQGKAITGANAFTGTVLAGLYGQIDVSGGTITSGHVAAIQANIYGANAGTIPMEGIYIESAGGGVINSFLQCFGKSTYVFDFASNTHNQMSTTGTPGAVTGGTGWLKVLVEGAVRYIPLASSVS